MRKVITRITVATLLLTISSPMLAQESGGGLVAVLDVAKVFKANPEFDAQMERIKDEAEALKLQIQKQQENIRSRAEAVAQMEIGSTERNQQEAALEQEQAALRTHARQAEADLLKREAKIYYDTYVKMQNVVGSLATKYGITLVLRFDSAEIDPENRGEVIKGVNRQVVYHHKLDLTKMVIQQLNPSAAQAPSGVINK